MLDRIVKNMMTLHGVWDTHYVLNQNFRLFRRLRHDNVLAACHAIKVSVALSTARPLLYPAHQKVQFR